MAEENHTNKKNITKITKNGNNTSEIVTKNLKKQNKIRNKVFGKNTMSLEKILDLLSPVESKLLKEELKLDSISLDLFNKIAKVLKNWAIKKKCYNFSFWFSNFNGAASEKVENFITFDKKGQNINSFKGENLMKTETDGSSFPTGELRNTSNATGIIVWDSSFNFFIYKKTLYIPGIFLTPKGESLDLKSPYLKSKKFLEENSLNLIKCFFPETNSIKLMLGWEQEFFLINKTNRTDIVLTGRTLIGNSQIKRQENIQHYFSPINPKFRKFFKKVIKIAYSLGIPIKVRHSEVAPSQFEFVYHFKEQNEAVNHNFLFCHIMKNVAEKYGLMCLFNEKPFNEINGSGKHCNLSIYTESNINLFSSEYQKDSLEYLAAFTFIVACISSIHSFGDVLMESIFSYENEKRLGGHEAPPSILSIYFNQLLLDEFLNDTPSEVSNEINLKSLSYKIKVNTTERNRTSPFAFLENRVEFRSVGSSLNTERRALIAFNTILGFKIKEFHTLFSGKSINPTAIKAILKEQLNKSKNVLFSGNGYSCDWQLEAEKRNLTNFKNTIIALEVLNDPKSFKVYIESNVFNKKELLSIYKNGSYTYLDKFFLNMKILKQLCFNVLIPVVEKFIIENYTFLEKIRNEKLKSKKTEFINKIEALLLYLYEQFDSLEDYLCKIEINYDLFKFDSIIHNILSEIRKITSQFEEFLPKEIWPFETYEDILLPK